MAVDRSSPYYSRSVEVDFLRNKVKPQDYLTPKLQNVGAGGFSSGDALSDVLANRIKSSYGGQLQDIRNKFIRDNPLEEAKQKEVISSIVAGNYADEKKRQALEKAEHERRKAKRKERKSKGMAIAGTVVGGLIGGPAGAQVGGGLGGMVGGS